MAPKFAGVMLIVMFSLVFDSYALKQRAVPKRPEPAPSAMAIGIDSVFIKIQQEFDQITASSVVKNKAVEPVNNYFFKALKENQLFYSLTRVNAKGVLINEKIRLIEKDEVKPLNLSKEAWVRRTITAHKPYWGMKKLEETGRYYLVWAAPVMAKDKKGKEIVDGAVSLKIDLWDSFHKYSNTTATPFLVRIDRMRLYSNQWKDSIQYKEERLIVPGVQKVSVRYPKVITPVAVPPAPQPVIAPTVDSTSIKATQDSLKEVKGALVKQQLKQKQQDRKNMITIAAILLVIFVSAILFIIIPMIRHRKVMKELDKSDSIF